MSTSARDARAAAKAAKAAAAAAREEKQDARRAELAESVRQAQDRGDTGATVDAVALGFALLTEKRRAQVLSLVRDFIPLAARIELHATTPPQRLDYDQAQLYLRVRTRHESYRLRACAKEAFTIGWIHEWIQPDDVLYDIGANVGAYSLVAAGRPGSHVRVVAFEPGYANVTALTENVVLNRLADRVTPLPIALSDVTGLNVFALRDMDAGAARHVLGQQSPHGAAPVYRQPVMTFRLDDAIEMFGLPAPNHIKLDVDGGELAVLSGAARTLALASLRSVLIEVSADLSTPVTEVLAQHGLCLQDKKDVLNKSGEHAVWYGLFARNAR